MSDWISDQNKATEAHRNISPENNDNANNLIHLINSGVVHQAQYIAQLTQR